MIRTFDDPSNFAQWLRNDPDSRYFTYARFGAMQTLELSDDDMCEHPARDGRWAPITLPSPDRARDWWKALFLGHILEFWHFKDTGGLSVVVAANANVWHPQDSMHAKLGAIDYRPIYHEEFVSLVGARTADEMTAEATLVGVSVRRIPATAAQRR